MESLPTEKRLNPAHLRRMFLEAYQTWFPTGGETPHFDIEIARLFLRAGLTQEAHDLLERGSAEFGWSAPRWYELALARIRLGRLDQAYEAVSQSLEVDRRFEPARKLMAAFQTSAAA